MSSRHLFIMLFLALLIITEAGASPRIALVIGNSSYQISPLKNPVNDATDMANTLTRSGFTVSLKINADQRTMVTAIREFGRTIKQQGGVGLFYYAGHGIQVRGRNYLIPLGAVIESEGDARFEAVDAGFVLSKMEDAGNDMNIVILDACRNNPFARSFRSSTQGLARMDAPKGSIIAYATAPGELAADGTGRNGIYTKHLIQNINTPQLRLEDVFKNVRRAVVQETGNKQVPWESSSLMGQFYFTQAQPQPSPAITKQNTAIDSSYEILFWESIKESDDIHSYIAYLNQFPDGVFAELAELKIKQQSTVLERQKTSQDKTSISPPAERLQEINKEQNTSLFSKNDVLENDVRLSIFPFKLKGYPEDIEYVMREINAALSKHRGRYTLQYAHYQSNNGQKPVIPADSVKDKKLFVDLFDNLWEKKNFFSDTEPNMKNVRIISKKIQSNLILMFYLDLMSNADVALYLIDLQNNDIFKKTYKGRYLHRGGPGNPFALRAMVNNALNEYYSRR